MNQHTITEEDVADANKGKPVVAVSMASGIYISCSCLIVHSCVADFINLVPDCFKHAERRARTGGRPSRRNAEPISIRMIPARQRYNY